MRRKCGKKPLIGSKWTDSKGRTWEVLEMVNPGRYSVGVMRTLESGARIATRIGEMYVAGIRAAMAAEAKICPACGLPCCVCHIPGAVACTCHPLAVEGKGVFHHVDCASKGTP